MKKYILLIALFVILIVALTLGNIPQPERIVVIPYIVIVQKPPEVIEKPVEVIREITIFVDREVIKEVVKIPREFVSVEEAQGWLDKNNLPMVIIANANSEFIFNKPSNVYNCNDYSKALQVRALKDGYLVTYLPVINGYVAGIKVTNITEAHIGLLTRIGDNYYYIEATPGYTDSFKLILFAQADRS